MKQRRRYSRPMAIAMALALNGLAAPLPGLNVIPPPPPRPTLPAPEREEEKRS